MIVCSCLIVSICLLMLVTGSIYQLLEARLLYPSREFETDKLEIA
jgi:hypothetical protein